jgi:hypothetical protein
MSDGDAPKSTRATEISSPAFRHAGMLWWLRLPELAYTASTA